MLHTTICFFHKTHQCGRDSTNVGSSGGRLSRSQSSRCSLKADLSTVIMRFCMLGGRLKLIMFLFCVYSSQVKKKCSNYTVIIRVAITFLPISTSTEFPYNTNIIKTVCIIEIGN